MSEFDVEVANLTKRFGDFTAVDDVSFSIPRGEFFSLLGPSGCGKTTIMRMISGFEHPTSGSVRIAGRDMAGIKPYQRPTNLVFQHLSLFPHLSVGRNISFGLEMAGVPKAEVRRQVAEMLDLVHLEGFGERRINHLSGGQKQRVAIARALVNRPTVLLLDEPLGALDLKLREQMQLELKRIQREVGTTFIYVTHDQKEAITMSNKIAVVNHGRIEQMDTSDAIYERPITAFVAGFIGETNLFEGALLERQGDTGTIRLADTTIRIHIDFEARPGDRISLSVRPERLRLSPYGTDDGLNRLSATIDDLIYFGSLTHYRLAAGDGTIITAEVQNSGDMARPRRGMAVEVAWRPEHAIAFPSARE